MYLQFYEPFIATSLCFLNSMQVPNSGKCTGHKEKKKKKELYRWMFMVLAVITSNTKRIELNYENTIIYSDSCKCGFKQFSLIMFWDSCSSAVN